MLLALLCLLMAAAHAAPPGNASPGALLSQVQHFADNDHAHFLSALHRLEEQQARLPLDQQQQVEYWKAWEAQHQGDYSRARRMFQQVVDHASDSSLVERAKSQLALNYMINREYVNAFTLTNELIANLDKITDPDVRERVLMNANDILIWQKQYDQALAIAKQLKASATTANSRCNAQYAETETLLQRGGVLTSSSPEFRQTVDSCLAVGRLSTANALRLDWASLMDDEGHTQQALALLHRITPDILKNGFKTHIIALYVTKAQAYLIEKKYGLALKWAQATLSATTPNTFTWTRQAAYEVLYQAQEHTGDYRGALASHKNYLAQYKASASDAKAQALAYQVVKQEVLTKRLRFEELSKQNRILQLRQSLDRKSAETNRLYILLLLVVLASIAFWAYRIKHSQIRFRKMARHDDLTGVFNRQYFFEQAEHTLGRLQKVGGHACLLILDMDHFKRVNDMYGHISGDVVLRHVAGICKGELRTSDAFGRLGGEEFGILMPGCTRTQGMEIGERMRRTLAHASVKVRENMDITVTASIGLACTEISGHALKPLLIAADEALYAAKRAGRNQLVAGSGPNSMATA